MCGRYTVTKPEWIKETFSVRRSPPAGGGRPRFNVAPSQKVPVVRGNGPDRTCLECVWGFAPTWAGAGERGRAIINARAESLDARPSFRDAFRTSRCILPADGFFEWTTAPNGGRQPFYIRPDDGRLLAFAGLCDLPGSRCLVITTAANSLMRDIHDRMPAILRPDQWEQWLDPGFSETRALAGMLAPREWTGMTAVRVGSLVNSPRNDDPRCVQPV